MADTGEAYAGGLPAGVERDVTGIPCECGGYCDKVDCTPEESEKYWCGNSRGCCDVAFVCRLCKKRYAGRQPAPNME